MHRYYQEHEAAQRALEAPEPFCVDEEAKADVKVSREGFACRLQQPVFAYRRLYNGNLFRYL